MNLKWYENNIFLGSGGNHPRADVLNVESSEIRTVFESSHMHSVYAVDIEVETNMITLGTNGGEVFLIKDIGSSDISISSPWKKIMHGAPVLSICWMDRSTIAVSDTVGRCFLWYIHGKPSFESLKIINGPVLSLIHVNDLLIGLTSGGKLHIWNGSDRKLVEVLDVPTPSLMGALVNMVYCSDSSSIFYPEEKGQLVTVNLENKLVKSFKAHDGALYALSFFNDYLISAGMDDARMKLWTVGKDKPSEIYPVKKGVISMASLGTAFPKHYLVDCFGKADEYCIEGGKLRFVNQLIGDNYRIVRSVQSDKLKVYCDQQKQAEVREVVEILSNNIDGYGHDIESYHHRLSELGYEHVSHGFHIEKALSDGDSITALRSSSKLLNIIPHNNPQSYPSMEKHAQLLESTWHIPEAHEIYKRILKNDPSYRFSINVKRICHVEEIMSLSLWIVEPDIEIETIIESATIIGKSFSGRFVINKLNAESCSAVVLTAEEIAEKYNQTREQLHSSLPVASFKSTYVIAKSSVEEVDMVIFNTENQGYLKNLQFALQILSDMRETLVVPVVIFSWPLMDKSFLENNSEALNVYSQIKSQAISNSYLKGIHKAVKHVIRRLITEKESLKRFST